LSTAYKILSKNVLSRLTPHAEEITGDHECGFRYDRSTTDHIFCTHQILEKKWDYNEAVHQLYIDIKKSYDSVRREVCIIFSLSLVPHETSKAVNICPNETYSRVWLGKHVPDTFPIENGLKKEVLYHHCFSNLLWNMPLGGFRQTRKA
jgi:hypothetical protein